MKPCTVEFQAFGPYAGHELVDFEKLAARGLFLICGKTGTGKTMILDAITFALYGKSSGHGRDDFEAMRCTNAAFDVTTYVRFTFENNGIYYRFERRLERKRKNLSASYMVWQKDENGTWTALFENAKEKMLNEKAEEIIGLSYEQFRQVIVLPQGQFEKFLTSDSADKEKILTSIFGEEKWQAVAQLMFEEATERRQQLKSLQEQISNSLQEEACETLAELEAVIAQKKERLVTMEAAYQEGACEKQIRALRDRLALVSRFQDLRRGKACVRAYEEKQHDRAEQEKRIQDARRAEKVKELLLELHRAEAAQAERKKAVRAADQAAGQAKQQAEQILLQVTAQQQKNDEIEEKKAQKIQLTAKITDYESIAALEQNFQKQRKAAESALQEAEQEKQVYESYAPKLVMLHEAYETDMEEHRKLLAAYLAGITGELAASLVEGQPCPVCGSREHPQKAVRTEADTSKEHVEEKRAEADAVYQKLQQTMQKQEQAKKKYEEKQRLAQELQLAKETAYTRLAEMQNNLIPEIGSLAELQKKLQQLTDEIGKDTEKLQSLTKMLEQANNTVAETAAKAAKQLWKNQMLLMERQGLFGEALSIAQEYLKQYPDDQAMKKECRFLKTRNEVAKGNEAVQSQTSDAGTSQTTGSDDTGDNTAASTGADNDNVSTSATRTPSTKAPQSQTSTMGTTGSTAAPKSTADTGRTGTSTTTAPTATRRPAGTTSTATPAGTASSYIDTQESVN